METLQQQVQKKPKTVTWKDDTNIDTDTDTANNTNKEKITNKYKKCKTKYPNSSLPTTAF